MIYWGKSSTGKWHAVSDLWGRVETTCGIVWADIVEADPASKPEWPENSCKRCKARYGEGPHSGAVGIGLIRNEQTAADGYPIVESLVRHD